MEWAIGIYTGETPFQLDSPDAIHNPVLTRHSVNDRRAEFVADPFMLPNDVGWHMFFEVMNGKSRKGEIGVATSADGFRWEYQQIVLSERFHLSYPCVFEWAGDYYMIPESFQARSVRLYRADEFPTRWSLVTTLLDGNQYVDASIFRFDERWWLFVGQGAPPYRADTLRLFNASELTGPWLEHPQSPVVAADRSSARPAGRVLSHNGRLIRYGQDCSRHYGTRVLGFEIQELTTASYQEREIVGNPVLAASGLGWNESGMHHLDARPMNDGSWIACVDGYFFRSNEAGDSSLNDEVK